MRILIVGHGVVGKNLEKELEVLHPDVIDKYKPEENKIEVPYGVRYDIAFICVDTPIRKEERVLCDTSEVKNAIMENEAEIYVIKSTVSPGTTEQLRVNWKENHIQSGILRRYATLQQLSLRLYNPGRREKGLH